MKRQLEAVRGIGSALAAMEKAERMLDVASTIPEVANVRDLLSAIKGLLKKCRASRKIRNKAAALNLRAERRMGELLAEIPKEQGKRTDATSSHDVTKLQETGLNRQEQQRLRRIADIPAADFDDYITTTDEEGLELTSAGMLRLWHSLNPSDPKPFLPTEEYAAIRGWLESRRDRWPEQYRPTFVAFVGRILAQLGGPDVDDRGGGVGGPQTG